MYQIRYLNKISPVGTSRFNDNYHCGEDVNNPDAIMVRSASMHEMELPKNLLAIARAGAGVNNIPIDKCSEQGIVVFNTPGANANAVKELVLAGLFLTSRKVVPAIEWAKTLKGKGDEVGKLVEKGKSAFVGPEIAGKTLGVIGLGAIGILVANAAKSLGMEVYGYDPYLSVEAAWGLSRSVHHARTLDEIFAVSDYVTVHVPLTPDTKYMINAESIAKMKDGVRVLNFARGELVNSADILAALASGKVSAYATDFPNDDVIGVEGVIAIPHLGASTPESEDNCASMAASELIDYLENGNIRNSVNLPSISMPRDCSCARICIIHRNVPNTISRLSGALAEKGINIENMQSKSKKDYAYTILDVTGELQDSTAANIEKLPEIIKVRIIK
ncbi:phosphoglycerate dehydrogenase [Caproiciproducens sp. LBM24188]|nr:3-phosphoglycerate dehydrogenase [Oscillospiraceae bacterium]HHV31383.1 phosphoglycerate dehydrogenase [Clostridiales bacterium]